MNSLKETVKVEDSAQIEKNLLEGVVSRAGTLFLTWALIASIFGFLSLDILRSKMPELTLWENLWPRLIYSALPMMIAAFFYKFQTPHLTRFKAWATVVLLPLFLMSSSLVHAWPIFWSGHHDFYLQFHATNIMAMASGIFVISGHPRLVLSQCAGFILIYFGPLFLLFSNNSPVISQVIISDSIIASIILLLTLKSVHKLRVALTVADHRRRKKASLFLGKHLTDAIYEDRQMVPDNFSRDGLIMSIDLRGYTNFFQSNNSNTVRAFMADYYSLSTKILASQKAFLHKTIGDGLLISFGIMDNEIDLSDLPESQKLNERVETQKKVDYLKRATEVFLEISRGLEDLSNKHQVTCTLNLGAGCAYGPIEILVRGDESYRQELDIQGSTIIKSVRLESYSKLLNKTIDADSSFLLLPPELIPHAHKDYGFKTLMIAKPEDQIRDFPDIRMILYRQWKHRSARSSNLKAA